MTKLINMLNKKPFSFDKPHKRGFKIEDKTVHFPKNLDKFLFGQMIQINQLIEKDINKNLLEIAAIAIQPVFDGEFVETRQSHFKKILEDLPVLEVFPELFFFARRLKQIKMYGQMTSIVSE